MAEQSPSAKQRRNQLPTEKLALLEDRIQRALAASSGTGIIPRRGQQDVLPLSYAQEGLWALSLIDPGHAASNNPILVRLRGELDLQALNQAFTALLQRQESLCCRMRSDLGSPAAQFSPVAEYQLPVIDFSGLPEEAARQAADEWIRTEIEAPVSIFKSPLMRAHLLRLPEGEHQLLMVFHHLVMDGWSKGIALWELGRFYSAAVEGRPAELPELSIAYSDFAAWQRARMGSPAVQPQMEFWKSRLRDLPPPFEIPTDHERQSALSSPAGSIHFDIESALVSQLERLGAGHGATLSMTLLASYLVLLKRFSGQSDLVIGLPVAGRTVHQMEDLIGLFINTLVFRCDLSGNPGFLAALEFVRHEAEQVYSNQEIPLEKLVSEIPHKRDPARPPFFQTLFNFKNLPSREIHFTGLEVDVLSTRARAVRYDLSLEMEKNEGGIRAAFNYNAALYENETISRLVESFLVLLDAVVQNPGQKIANLPLLSVRTREMLLREWDSEQVDLPDELSLHRTFSRAAKSSPEKTAIRHLDANLSYRELDERSDRLAAYLQKKYQLSGQTAAICMDSCPKMVVCMLAVLKAGGAFLLLDPQQPEKRLEWILEDARPRIVLTDPEHAGRSLVCRTAVERINDDLEARLRTGYGAPEDKTSPAQIACLVYISGPMGKPAGVMVSQRSLQNWVLWSEKQFGLSSKDAVLQSSPAMDEIGIYQIFAALASGATLEVEPARGEPEAASLKRVIQDRGISVIALKPFLLNKLLDSADFSEFSSLRLVLCVGEELPGDLAGQFRQATPAELVYLYSSVETGVVSWVPHGGQIAAGFKAAIGKPAANTQAYILDEALQPAPVGVIGELCIGGEGLALGYLNQPGWTAEAFLPNPFGKTGSRLFRTGDLAAFQADGNVRLLGRKDRRVVAHGVRIEPAEIEQALFSVPGVCAAVVEATRPASDADMSLAAYIVQDGDAQDVFHAARELLLQRFPAEMVPGEFIFVDELPLLPGRKLDHSRLKTRSSTWRFSKDAFHPRSAFERLIADIWSEILQFPLDSSESDFFELGGNSLLALRLIGRINDLLGADIAIDILFKTKSFSEFVGELRAALGRDNDQIDKMAAMILEILEPSDDKNKR